MDCEGDVSDLEYGLECNWVNRISGHSLELERAMLQVKDAIKWA